MDSGTKYEKYVDILALTSQIQELKILFAGQLKEYGGRINPATVPTRFQVNQIGYHSSQRRWPWYGFYFAQ